MTDDTDLIFVPANNTPSHRSYDASFNEDNNNDFYTLEFKKKRAKIREERARVEKTRKALLNLLR